MYDPITPPRAPTRTPAITDGRTVSVPSVTIDRIIDPKKLVIPAIAPPEIAPDFTSPNPSEDPIADAANIGINHPPNGSRNPRARVVAPVSAVFVAVFPVVFSLGFILLKSSPHDGGSLELRLDVVPVST